MEMVERVVPGMKDLIVRFSADPVWASSVAARISDAIAAELPDAADDPDFVASLRASTAANIRLLVEMVCGEVPPHEATPPPAAVEYAREFVRRGMSIDSLLRAYFVGHATFFNLWREELDTRIEDPAELARPVEEFATWTFTFVQALTAGIVERYSDERERWIRSSAAVRAELVEAILAGEPLELDATSTRICYRLDRCHLAFVVWSTEIGEAVDPAVLERTAVELADACGTRSPLLLPQGTSAVAGWVGSGGTDDHRDDLEAVLEREGSIRAAFGSEARGVEGFRKSHLQALEARRVAMLAGRAAAAITWYGDVALCALASTQTERAQEFCDEQLGPLMAGGERTERLAETLLCYLEENASPRRAAKRLGVHENTVVNRIRTTQELVGRPLEQRIGETIVALRLAPLFRQDPRP